MTRTERLLALLLIEMMETRGYTGHAVLAERLSLAGFSTKEIASLLGTTAASLAVAKARSRRRASQEHEK